MNKFSIALATAGLAASLGAYAAVPTDAQPYQIIVPNLKSGLEVTLEGLLLQPTASNLNYATVDSISAFSPSTAVLTGASSSYSSSVNPSYDFGFRVGLGYIFPNSGNDVQLSWTHFDHSSDATSSANSGQTLVTGLGTPLVNFAGTTALLAPFAGFSAVNAYAPFATSSASIKYNAIDLDVGQYIAVGTRLTMRMFGGLRGAQVESNQTNNYGTAYSVADAATGAFVGGAVYSENDNFNSKFTGIGPRLGVDTSYHLGDCFGVIAHVAGSLLVGQVKSSTNSIVTTSFAPTPAFLSTTNYNDSVDNTTRVVPALDAKLGLDYTYIFTNQSMLSLEAGYQWTQYIDAVDKYRNDGVAADGSVVVDKSTSGVGFNGPYLTLNYKV